MTSLSFIGLGTMGRLMCRRLIDAGHDVAVWNRSAGAADDLVAAGATFVDAPDALARPLILSMLANDAAVDEVFSEARLRNAPAGSVHVAFESLSLAAADRAESRHRDAGLSYVAAPVLGRPPVAAAGRLNILAAGPKSVVDALGPVLAVLGSRTWYLGEQPRLANLVKICVNYNLIHTIQALAETVTIAERGGVDPALFVELLTGTLYSGTAYAGYGAQIAERRYEPVGFSLPLGLKDLSLAEQAAAETGTWLPTTATLRTLFESALLAEDLATKDWAAVAEVTRRGEANR